MTAAAKKSARRRSADTAVASRIDITNRTRPERENVIGSEMAHAMAAAIASHAGARRALSSITAAAAHRVRNRAVMFGSANVMLRLLATTGFGVQIVWCVRPRAVPTTPRPEPDAGSAGAAR